MRHDKRIVINNRRGLLSEFVKDTFARAARLLAGQNE
jgi:hypothetical protein